MLGPWYGLISIRLFKFGLSTFPLFATGNLLTLWRCPGSNLALARASSKVSLRFTRICPGDSPFHSHLFFKLRPKERQCSFRILIKLLGFGTAVIGKENESITIHILHQHHS